MLKKLIKSALKKTGRVLHPYNEHEEKLKLVKDKWLKNYGIRTVIDVGANNGWYAQRIRQLLPYAMIYSFEPLQLPYEKLVSKFENDDRFKAYNIACDTMKGSKSFFENKKSVSSSFLPMADLHKKSFPGSAEVNEIRVETDTLNNIFQSTEIASKAMLKMDVQGYELNVLKGADILLSKIDLIYTEVSFRELYEGQPLINEITEFLMEKGFIISGIDHVDRSLIDGSSLQADVYFEKRG